MSPKDKQCAHPIRQHSTAPSPRPLPARHVPPPAPAHQLETVTTTVEVRQSPNGDTVQIVNEERIEQVIDVDQPMDVTAGAAEVPINVDGMNEVILQEQVQYQPQMFDVDLERMHLDLYRDKYLTPDEFLDDVRKIVHNANVRANEDPERLFRAQAMLTAAEVSIQDFDANFRLECQRMASREQKRRDEYKRSRAKDKANEESAQSDTPNVPIRRSTRNTGQQLELTITDPLKLERSLKRARSSEANAEPSEEEGGNEGHAAKRSRVSSAEVDGLRPLTHIGSPPPRAHAVRFVDDISQKEEPPSPTPRASNPLPELPAHPHVRPEGPSRPGGGFDPALLNPMSPDTEQRTYLPPAATSPALQLPAETQLTSQVPNGIMHAPIGHPQERSQNVPPEGEGQSELIDAPRTPEPPSHPPTELPVPVPEPLIPEPMVIERTPTPLPDFVLDIEGLTQLQTTLRDKTDPLNIEQLEQLRAACLAVVWKHRSKWDRSGLIKELKDTVDRYVEEVSLDDMDSSSPVNGY